MFRFTLSSMVLLIVNFTLCGCANGPGSQLFRPAQTNNPSADSQGLSDFDRSLPSQLDQTPKQNVSDSRILGHSVQGRGLELFRFGTGQTHTLVIGSVHGDEPEGIELSDRLIRYLRNNPDTLRRHTVYIMRDGNPDGHIARSRTNARGVDLNRNFPSGNWKKITKNGKNPSGTQPASEPETRTILDVIHQLRPDRIIAIHSTRGNPMVNYDGPALTLARRMSQFNGYQVSDYIGYPTPGSLGTYLGHDGQIPIITLELPRGIPPQKAWRENRNALLEGILFDG